MKFPESLSDQFELVEKLTGEKPIESFRVRNKQRKYSESVVRLLHSKFSGNGYIVDRFHSFFADFSSVPSRTYLPAIYSITGVTGSDVFAVEEYASGLTLPRFIGTKQSFETFRIDVVDVLTRVCEALHHAHQKNVFHLCISLSDIIVDSKSSSRVKLVGFGTQIFTQGMGLGSLSDSCKRRIAPEIINNSHCNPSSDIYTLCVAIKDLVSGPDDWDELINRGLAEKPSDRPSSAREFSQLLKELGNGKALRSVQGPGQNVNSTPGGLLPKIRIKSNPIGAEVRLNGKPVGMTSQTGLTVSLLRGARLEISKSGYKKAVLEFDDITKESEICFKLESQFILFTNPWGASVRVDGTLVGETTREGLEVPWKGHTIEVEKSGYTPETLKFISQPMDAQSCVELQPLVDNWHLRGNRSWITLCIFAGFLLCLVPINIYYFFLANTTRLFELRDNEKHISKVKTPPASLQNQSIPQKRQINHAYDMDLINACIAGDLKAVERFLKMGADPNAKSSIGLTGLMYAATRGSIEGAKVLLTYGADPDVKTSLNESADDYARGSDRHELMTLFDEFRKHKQTIANPASPTVAELKWYVIKDPWGTCNVIESRGKDRQAIAGPFDLKDSAEKAKTELCRTKQIN